MVDILDLLVMIFLHINLLITPTTLFIYRFLPLFSENNEWYFFSDEKNSSEIFN